MALYQALKNTARSLLYLALCTQAALGSESRLETYVNNTNAAPTTQVAPQKQEGEKYAILMSGHAESEKGIEDRFWLALTDVYTSLVKQGVPKENIYVLHPGKPVSILPRNQEISDYVLSEANSQNFYWASKENLKEVTGKIAKKSTKKDNLKVYACGHAEQKNGTSNYFMHSEPAKGSKASAIQTLTNEELNSYLAAISIGKALVQMDVCEGGFKMYMPNFYTSNTAENKDKGSAILPDFSFGAILFKNLDDLTDKESVKKAHEASAIEYKGRITDAINKGIIPKQDEQFVPSPVLSLPD